MFQVLVIGDEEYNREHVVLSIQDIVPDTDNTRVRTAMHGVWNDIVYDYSRLVSVLVCF